MAKKLGADLIILGISGPRKIADRLGQTVAYRVVCAAPCPVLRIREPVPGPYFEKLFAMEAARPRTGSGSRTNKKESEESKTTAGGKGNRGKNPKSDIEPFSRAAGFDYMEHRSYSVAEYLRRQ